jgi:hypothetical protein
MRKERKKEKKIQRKKNSEVNEMKMSKVEMRKEM